MNTPKLYASVLAPGCSPSCLNSFPKSAIWTHPNWCFSLMKPISCLIMPALPYRIKLSRWCASFARKVWGFILFTQNPLDLPESVLGQLGNRVQHALRAFTPKDQKAVKTAAETFRANPEFKVDQVITELAVGEALISCLDEKRHSANCRTWLGSCRRIHPLHRSRLKNARLSCSKVLSPVFMSSQWIGIAPTKCCENKVAERQQQAAAAEPAQTTKQGTEALAKQQIKEQERLARERAKRS